MGLITKNQCNFKSVSTCLFLLRQVELPGECVDESYFALPMKLHQFV